MKTNIDRNLIFDLGMHDGQDTDYYLKKGFRVVAVEANPVLATEARARFQAQLDKGQLELLNVAIAQVPGTFDFFVNHQNSKWSSLHLDWGKRGHKGYHKITVPGVPLAEIVKDHGVPYYLKIDIEGADLMAVDAIFSFPTPPAFVSVEGGGENFLQRFERLGYDRFLTVNQAKVPETTLPSSAREGNEVEHRFPMGASGAFGRDLPGPWMTLDDIRAERLRHKQIIDDITKRFPDNPNQVMAERERLGIGWYDVHATRQEFLAD